MPRNVETLLAERDSSERRRKAILAIIEEIPLPVSTSDEQINEMVDALRRIRKLATT